MVKQLESLVKAVAIMFSNSISISREFYLMGDFNNDLLKAHSDCTTKKLF